MRVLDRISRNRRVCLEVVRDRYVSHAEALAMKRRSHIVIEECVTGSYHRNSREGLATGCVVVNALGLVPFVVDALRRCSKTYDNPFVFSTLADAERVLSSLIERGPRALEEEGRKNREWLTRHWDFAKQWEIFWKPSVNHGLQRRRPATATAPQNRRVTINRRRVAAPLSHFDVNVIIPHGGTERLPQLTAAPVSLRQRDDISEILAELGEKPVAKSVAASWADKYAFVAHTNPFERAVALNAGAAVARAKLLLWYDNDILTSAGFVRRSAQELCDRRLDCLIPYTSVRYLPLGWMFDLLEHHDFVGHRKRARLISNAFIAARPGSRIAAAFYEQVRHRARSGTSFHWNGVEPLTAIVEQNRQAWFEVPCQSIQLICWSQPELFFERRSDQEHEAALNATAYCYMLSNWAVKNYQRKNPDAGLMGQATFFSFLLRRVVGQEAAVPPDYESVFQDMVELYRQQRSDLLSGPGSWLANMRELRERLLLLLEELGIRSLLDASCGDFHWMQHMRLGPDEYVGVNIQGEIVAENQRRYASRSRRFARMDIIRDPLPRTDGVLCRDCLTHLSFDDVFPALRNFKPSGPKYLLITTFTGDRPNSVRRLAHAQSHATAISIAAARIREVSRKGGDRL
jgi:hypothetical protein